MNRIKFRQPVVDKRGKFLEWHYWGRVDHEWIEAVIHLNGKDTRNDSQQFTGLSDKNGTEIYEGDILGDQYESIGVVVWNQDSASWLIEYGDDLQSIEEGDLSWSEVIGNIHENPELITK